MKLWTVQEHPVPGIQVRLFEDGQAYVTLGDSCMRVSESIRDGFCHVMAEAQRVAKTPEHPDKELADNLLDGPPSKRWLRLLEADLGEGLDLHLVRPQKQKQRWETDDALVLVQVQTLNGHVSYHARAFTESWEAGRLVQSHCAFPPPGISILWEKKWEKLVQMAPGTGFVIERTGRLEGLPPKLIVSWNGRELHMKERYHRSRDKRQSGHP